VLSVRVACNVPTLDAGGFLSKISIKIKLLPHYLHIILKMYPTGNKRLLWQGIFAQKSSKWISFENQKKPHLRVLGKCLSLENRFQCNYQFNKETSTRRNEMYVRKIGKSRCECSPP